MSISISFPNKEHDHVSIAGTFNNWQPEPMQMSEDRKSFVKILTTQKDGAGEHTFKFFTEDGNWILEPGRPTSPDENGVLNHKVLLESSASEALLDRTLDTALSKQEKETISAPGKTGTPKDLGTEVLASDLYSNQYPAEPKTHTGTGPGLVDAQDISTKVGEQRSSAAHDSHLNPSAPVFNPIAPPFIPASNPPPQRNSSQSSNQRRRSQSRSRTSHSRNSSIVSQRARSASSTHHEDLNPAAHEFRPQFAQPTNHIPHASGYAAALKKPASPPLKEDFKKPHLPSKGPSKPTASRPTSSEAAPVIAPTTGSETSSVNAVSYASVAKHAAPEDLSGSSASSSLSSLGKTEQPSIPDQKTPEGDLTEDVVESAKEGLEQVKEQGSEVVNVLVDAASEGQEKVASMVTEQGNGSTENSSEKRDQTKAETQELQGHTTSKDSDDPPESSEQVDGSHDVEKTITAVSDSVKQQVTNAVESAKPLADKAVEVSRDISTATKETAKTTAHHAADLTDRAAESLQETAKATVEDIDAALENTKRDVQSGTNQAVDIANDAMTNSKNTLSSAAHTMSASVSSIASSTQDKVSSAAQSEVAQTSEIKPTPAHSVLETVQLSTAQYDEEQIRLMDEMCILLDRDDKPVGSASKKDAHLMVNINEGLLHRAFSLFIFNSSNQLLLQQRASEKITFPGMWTNTCCSHPLDISGEVAEDLAGSIAGVKKAAQRKVLQELGIQASEAPVQDMTFLTRIHYLAPSDGQWGEHEIDYILFLRSDPGLQVNPNEVKDHKWVSQQQLREMFAAKDLSYTPWFKLICETFLFNWWGHLNNLEPVKDDNTIHRMGIEPALFDKITHSETPETNKEHPTETASDMVHNVATAIKAQVATISDKAVTQAENLAGMASDLQQSATETVASAISAVQDKLHMNDVAAPDTESIEPAAEDILPVGTSMKTPRFEPSDVAPADRGTSQTVGSPAIADASEPAAEDGIPPPIERDNLVESEVQASFNATNTEADARQTAQTPDAVLELSAAGQARAAAHAEPAADPDSVSRPSTGKSIRAKQNFFFYIFNSLFGGVFRGFTTLFHKLAFWRKSPHPE